MAIPQALKNILSKIAGNIFKVTDVDIASFLTRNVGERIAGAIEPIAKAAKEAGEQAGEVLQKEIWTVIPTTKNKQPSSIIAEIITSRGVKSAEGEPLIKKIVKEYTLNPKATSVHIIPDERLILLPTRPEPGSPSSPEIIGESLEELKGLVQSGKVRGGILMPQIGTGRGGLDWDVVKPVVQRKLQDIPEDTFVLVSHLETKPPDIQAKHAQALAAAEAQRKATIVQQLAEKAQAAQQLEIPDVPQSVRAAMVRNSLDNITQFLSLAQTNKIKVRYTPIKSEREEPGIAVVLTGLPENDRNIIVQGIRKLSAGLNIKHRGDTVLVTVPRASAERAADTSNVPRVEELTDDDPVKPLAKNLFSRLARKYFEFGIPDEKAAEALSRKSVAIAAILQRYPSGSDREIREGLSTWLVPRLQKALGDGKVFRSIEDVIDATMGWTYPTALEARVRGKPYSTEKWFEKARDFTIRVLRKAGYGLTNDFVDGEPVIRVYKAADPQRVKEWAYNAGFRPLSSADTTLVYDPSVKLSDIREDIIDRTARDILGRIASYEEPFPVTSSVSVHHPHFGTMKILTEVIDVPSDIMGRSPENAVERMKDYLREKLRNPLVFTRRMETLGPAETIRVIQPRRVFDALKESKLAVLLNPKESGLSKILEANKEAAVDYLVNKADEILREAVKTWRESKDQSYAKLASTLSGIFSKMEKFQYALPHEKKKYVITPEENQVLNRLYRTIRADAESLVNYWIAYPHAMMVPPEWGSTGVRGLYSRMARTALLRAATPKWHVEVSQQERMAMLEHLAELEDEIAEKAIAWLKVVGPTVPEKEALVLPARYAMLNLAQEISPHRRPTQHDVRVMWVTEEALRIPFRPKELERELRQLVPGEREPLLMWRKKAPTLESLEPEEGQLSEYISEVAEPLETVLKRQSGPTPIDRLQNLLVDGIRMDKKSGTVYSDDVVTDGEVAARLIDALNFDFLTGKKSILKDPDKIVRGVVSRIYTTLDPLKAKTATYGAIVERLGMLAHASRSLAVNVDSLLNQKMLKFIPDSVYEMYLVGNKEASAKITQLAKEFAEAASKLEMAAVEKARNILLADPDVEKYIQSKLASMKEAAEAVDGYTLGLGLFPMNLLKKIVQPDTRILGHELLGKMGWRRMSPTQKLGAKAGQALSPTYYIMKQHEITAKLYDIRAKLDIERAEFIEKWEKAWADLWRGVNWVSRERIINAVEGKLGSPLSPKELEIARRYREFTMRLAEETYDHSGRPLKHKVGDEVLIRIPGRTRRVRARIIAEDPEEWKYTVEYSLSPKSEPKRQEIPISEVDPAVLQNYFPHRFKGSWVVYYAGADDPGKKMSVFNTVENAMDYILENREWKGVPFREYLLKKYALSGASQDEIIAMGLEKEGVIIHARWMIPNEFTTNMTPKQVGVLSSRINKQIQEALKNMGVELKEGGISSKDIFKLILKSDVVLSPTPVKPKRVSATLPRTANLTTYIGDPDLAFDTHIWQLASQMTSNKWRKAVTEAVDSLKAELSAKRGADEPLALLLEFTTRWARDVDSYVPSFIDEIFRSFGMVDARLLRTMRTASMWMSAFKLFNLISPLVNLTQTLVTTYPTLGAKYTMRGIQLLGRYYLTRDPELGKILTEAGAKIFAPAYSLDPYVGIYRRKDIGETLAGLMLAPFQTAEQFNRGVAALGAYARALDSGHPDPLMAARMVVHRTQGDYSKTGTAAVLRNPAMSFFFQFKKFFLLYTSFILDMFGRALSGKTPRGASVAEFDSPAKELARWILASTAVGGILSLPLVAVVDRYSTKYLGFSPLLWLRESVSPPVYDFITRGVPSIFNVDLSGRIGIGRDIDNLIRGPIERGVINADTLTDLSPWASTFMQTFEAFKDVVKYGDDWAIDRLISQLAPAALWYVYYALKQRDAYPYIDLSNLADKKSVYITEPGIYSVRKGAKIIDPPDDSPMFWLKKMLGFQTPLEMDVYNLLSMVRDMEERMQSLKSRYERLGVNLYSSGRVNELEKLIAEAEEKGIPLDFERVGEIYWWRQGPALQRLYERSPKYLRQFIERAMETYTGKPPEYVVPQGVRRRILPIGR